MQTSIELVKREIFRFLASSEPETLCIRGKWGVGKTYSWKHFLRDAYSSKGIMLDRYAYVSLFGINSLDDLKYSIFENTVRQDQVVLDASPETFRFALESAEAWGRKGAWLANLIPGVRSYFGAAAPAFFLTVRNQIICIDDLERKGARLDVADILGLISFLKDQRRCKVVLLLNDGALQGDGKEAFHKYFEKVVDSSIQFAPTPSECAEIALTGTASVDAQLRDHCVCLGIANIRVMKKIERIANLVVPILRSFEPDLLQYALKAVVLLGWITYAREDAPSKEFVVHRRRDFSFGLADKNNKLNNDEQKWNELLNVYEFSHCEEFDLALLDGIERGFFDELRIRKEASDLNSQFVATRAQQSLKKAWTPYHASFDDNEDEVIQNVYGGCRANIKFISPNTLDAAVRLLKDLDANEKADELLKRFEAERGGEEGLFDLDSNPFSEDIRDLQVIALFNEQKTEKMPHRSPLQALQNIASGGWGSSDEKSLESLSVEAFRDLFKSLRGHELHMAVHGSRHFREIGNATDSQKAIARVAEDALILIGQESRLNRRRMQKYGINVD